MPSSSIPSTPIRSPENSARSSPPLDLSQRADLVEMMEQPCSYEDLSACLRDIARVNRLTFAERPTLSWLAELVTVAPGRPLRIVDVGCGYGETLRHIHVWAAKRRVPVTLTGIDLNADAIRAAKEATSPTEHIEWIVGDALSNDASGEVDVVISSLLTHHLTNPQIVHFLQWMERTARRGWFINDLHRKSIPYHLFRLWARFTTWHPFVKNDGPISIRRSFLVEDWQNLCSAAGIPLDIVAIQEYRPARLCVGRIK